MAIDISSNISFPSQFDSYDNKIQKDFGLKVGKSIESEWFYGGANSLFNGNKLLFQTRRSYAKGTNSIQHLKKDYSPIGDKSFLDLSDKSLTKIPKYVDVIVNGFCNRGYSVRASATDPLSVDKRASYRKDKEDDMLTRDLIEIGEKKYGDKLGSTPLDQIPTSKMELDLHMALEYKQSCELSVELAVDVVKNENLYDETIDKACIQDLTVCGIASQKHKFVPSRGIVTENVDVENLVWSYTEDPYFRDCFYIGEYKRVPFSEVLTEFQWLNSPENEDIKKRLGNSSSDWDNYNAITANEKLKGTVNILYFTYKTTRERANKIIETETNGKEVGNFNPSKNENKDYRPYKRIQIVEEVEFEGALVLGTDILLEWKVCENMIRPKSNLQKVIPKYFIVAPNKYKNHIDSLVARMIPIQEKLDTVELKKEQIIKNIKADGYIIDPDAIAEMDFGAGNTYSVQNIYDMFMQNGTIFARSVGEDGNSLQLPIRELKVSGSLDKLVALENQKQTYENDMRDVIGLNKASDASSPDKDTLLGAQKMASNFSNLATRHILSSACFLRKRMAEGIFYRTADLIKYTDLKEDFIRKIGATAVTDLESMANLHLYDFAFEIDLELDEEQKAKLEDDMSLEIQKGTFTFEDKHKVLNIKNFKYAVLYAAMLRDKREAKLQEQKMADIQANASAQANASVQSEQAKQQTLQLEGQLKIENTKLINQGLQDKERVKGSEDRLTLEIELTGKKEIAEINGGIAVHKFNEGESGKSKRITEQGKLKQKLQNGEPIDETDDIDIFELES